MTINHRNKKTAHIARERSAIKDSKGATALEFALIAPPMFALMFGTLDFGYQAYVNVTASSVANRIAREVSARSIATTDIEMRARDLMGSLVKADDTLTVETRSYFDYSGVGQPESIVTDSNGNGAVDEGDCFEDVNENGEYDLDLGKPGVGTSDDVVNYTVTINAKRLFPIQQFLGLSNEFTSQASYAVRNQPFGIQGTVITQKYCVVGGVNVAS